MDAEALSARMAAIASAPRMRILAHLADGPVHVSELARRVGMSRALLYMHLTKLDEVGYVTGHLALSDTGTALKYFEAVPFSLTVDLATIVAAVDAAAQETPGGPPTT